MKYLFFWLSSCVLGQMVIKESVYFELGSSTLNTQAKQIVKQLIPYKKDYTIRINGFTDAQGTEVYNSLLSKSRADQVATQLLSQGFSSTQLIKNYYGEQPKGTWLEDSLNRRVDILCIPKKFTPYFNTTNLPKEHFSVNENEQHIVTEGGTIFWVPAECFIDAQGNIIKGKVDLYITSYEKPHTWALNNLTTETTDGKFLTTGGMYYLEAYQKDKRLHLNPSTPLAVRNAYTDNKDMKTWNGQVNADNQVVWNPDRAVPSIRPRTLRPEYSSNMQYSAFYRKVDPNAMIGINVNGEYIELPDTRSDLEKLPNTIPLKKGDIVKTELDEYGNFYDIVVEEPPQTVKVKSCCLHDAKKGFVVKSGWIKLSTDSNTPLIQPVHIKFDTNISVKNDSSLIKVVTTNTVKQYKTSQKNLPIYKEYVTETISINKIEYIAKLDVFLENQGYSKNTLHTIYYTKGLLDGKTVTYYEGVQNGNQITWKKRYTKTLDTKLIVDSIIKPTVFVKKQSSFTQSDGNMVDKALAISGLSYVNIDQFKSLNSRKVNTTIIKDIEVKNYIIPQYRMAVTGGLGKYSKVTLPINTPIVAVYYKKDSSAIKQFMIAPNDSVVSIDLEKSSKEEFMRSLRELLDSVTIQLVPNPISSGELLTFKGLKVDNRNSFRFRLLDLWGRTLHEEIRISDPTVRLPQLTNGVYVASLLDYNGNVIFQGRIVIQ